MTLLIKNIPPDEVAKLKYNSDKSGNTQINNLRNFRVNPKGHLNFKTKEVLYDLMRDFGDSKWFMVTMYNRYNMPIILFYNESFEHLRVSFSLPNYYFGVNFIPYDNPKAILKCFYEDLCKQFDLKNFPDFNIWEVTRADAVLQFLFENQEIVEDVFYYLGALDWGAKDVCIYPKTSINFKGSTASGRIYNKYEESVKKLRKLKKGLGLNNYGRKMKIEDEEDIKLFLDDLLSLTKGLVRFELELKDRLKNTYREKILPEGAILSKSDRKNMTVEQFFSSEYFTLESLFTDEAKNLFGDSTKTFTGEYINVARLLNNHFKDSKNRISKINDSISAYVGFCSCGKKFLERLTNKTFANTQKKLMRDLGISTSKAVFKNSFRKNDIPKGFYIEQLHNSPFSMPCKTNEEVLEILKNIENPYFLKREEIEEDLPF